MSQIDDLKAADAELQCAALRLRQAQDEQNRIHNAFENAKVETTKCREAFAKATEKRATALKVLGL